jgi:hypothetical protein
MCYINYYIATEEQFNTPTVDKFDITENCDAGWAMSKIHKIKTYLSLSETDTVDLTPELDLLYKPGLVGVPVLEDMLSETINKTDADEKGVIASNLDREDLAKKYQDFSDKTRFMGYTYNKLTDVYGCIGGSIPEKLIHDFTDKTKSKVREVVSEGIGGGFGARKGYFLDLILSNTRTNKFKAEYDYYLREGGNIDFITESGVDFTRMIFNLAGVTENIKKTIGMEDFVALVERVDHSYKHNKDVTTIISH